MNADEFSKKIDAGTLAGRLRERACSFRVFCVGETDSTNDDAAKMLAAVPPPNGIFAVVADAQRAGRGRAGRKWASAQTGNLYLSCGFRPDVPPARLANFTLWLGVAIAKMLREKFGVPAFVKWPNDIFCGGKKIAGMLTEARLDSARVRSVVFGLGLNVNLDPETLPEDVRGIAASMRSALGSEKPLDVNFVCAETLSAIEAAYGKFLSGEHASALAALWRDFDMLDGKAVRAVYGNEEISGTACGIDASGRIRITDTAGTLRAFSAGDVSLRKNF